MYTYIYYCSVKIESMEMVLVCVTMGLTGPLVNFVQNLTNLEPTALKVNITFLHCVSVTCIISDRLYLY